jgi:hypothetical protein
MVVLIILAPLLIVYFYGKIFFTEQTRAESKEIKRKVEYYNRVNIKRTPTIEDFKTTSAN